MHTCACAGCSIATRRGICCVTSPDLRPRAHPPPCLRAGLALLITSAAKPCCKHCAMFLEPAFASPLCASVTPPPPGLCGMTLAGKPMRSSKRKAANRGFALGQHAALAEVQRQPPTRRARAVLDLLSLHLHQHARIRLHRGKARLWNASGREPPGVRELGSVEDPVWLGDHALPSEQGLVASASSAAVPFSWPRSSSSRGPSRISSCKVRCLTCSPFGCCFCFAPRPGAAMFCAHCRPRPRWLLPSPMMLPSRRVLRICWAPVPSRAPPSRSQSSLSSRAAPTCALEWLARGRTLLVLQRQLPRLADEILARLHAQEPSGPALLGVLRFHEALTAAGFGNQAPPSLTEQFKHMPEPSARGWQAPAAAAIAERADMLHFD